VAFVDVEKTSSTIRTMQREKRDKEQADESFFSAVTRLKDPDNLLSDYGECSHLMSKEKATFVSHLSEEMCNQLKLAKDNDWDPKALLGDRTLGFAGARGTHRPRAVSHLPHCGRGGDGGGHLPLSPPAWVCARALCSTQAKHTRCRMGYR